MTRRSPLSVPIPWVAISAAWVAVFWCALVAVPLVAVLSRASGAAPLLDPTVLKIAGITAAQALISATLASAIGLPLGLWIGSRGGKSATLAEMVLALPFGVPTVVAGVAWVLLFGRSGVLAQLDIAYSFKAIVLAHVVFNIPWVALLVAQARLRLPENQKEAAQTLGASAWQRFRFVIWPQTGAAFWSATTQAFTFCAMSFALVLVLGGGPPVQTLETALYSRVRYGSLDLNGAVACAFWQLLITLIPWAIVAIVHTRGERRVATTTSAMTSPGRTGWVRVAVAAIFFLPYVAALHFGTLSEGAREEIQDAAKTSLIITSLTALTTVLTALAATVFLNAIRGRAARAITTVLLNLPGGISALVLGLGIWLAYNRWIDPFSGSLAAMVGLQASLFFTIAFRVLWPVAQQSQPRLLEAALSLGASPSHAFWVAEWPRWRPAIVAALALVAGASLGEVAAVSLFYSENLIPLPLLISRWATQYRFEDAQWVAGLLLLLSTVTIAVVYLGRNRREIFR